MKAWELMHNKKVLDEGKSIEDVKIIRNEDDEITAEIEGFEVSTYISFNNPSFAECNCSHPKPCKHEVGLIYSIEMHPELISKDCDYEDILRIIRSDDLIDFLLNEFKSNDDLKNKFMNEVRSKPLIDKSYYKNRLNRVFKTGEAGDFEYNGIYDLDLMETGLKKFLNDDIYRILTAGEYDFACELLLRIGDLLNDELISIYDSWEDLAIAFMQHVDILSFSIYLDADKMDELYSKTDHITTVLTFY